MRARELQDVYTSVSQSPESSEQRVCVLRKLRDTVQVSHTHAHKHSLVCVLDQLLTSVDGCGQEHACQLTDDIISLVEREVDLMKRGVRSENLDGLRKRISTLVLHFIKTPEFNPEVAKLLEVSRTPPPRGDALLLDSRFLRVPPP